MKDKKTCHSFKRVAIIGAGISGLTAGLTLKDAGADVTVFEKSRGPGGRMASKRSPQGSVDIGAQYFTVRNPGFQALLERYAGGHYQPWSGRLVYRNAEGESTSFHPSERYVGVPRMSAITRALSQSLVVETSVRVGQLSAGTERCWALWDDQDQHLGEFDAVVITAPPQQALDLGMASGLTALQEAVEPHRQQLEPCWAAAFWFEKPLQLGFEGIQCRTGGLSWAANNSSKPAREGEGEWWVLHASPEWSRERVELAPEQVTQEMLDLFASLTGTGQQPQATLVHRWLYARSQPALSREKHLWLRGDNVGLCGDWLVGGRVEGAYESAASLLAAWREAGHLS